MPRISVCRETGEHVFWSDFRQRRCGLAGRWAHLLSMSGVWTNSPKLMSGRLSRSIQTGSSWKSLERVTACWRCALMTSSCGRLTRSPSARARGGFGLPQAEIHHSAHIQGCANRKQCPPNSRTHCPPPSRTAKAVLPRDLLCSSATGLAFTNSFKLLSVSEGSGRSV